MLLRILSVASVILGLYLIISFFFMGKPVEIKQPTIYHLGCYDPNNIINHSQQLTQKISKMQDNFQKSTKLNMYNSKVLTENFDKDIRDVAKTFQIYLHEYYKTRGASRQLLSYQNSIKTAKYQFNTCKKSINFDINECINSWKQFSSTSAQLDTIKRRITQLLSRKQKKQQQLSLTIFPKNPTFGQDEIQKKYLIKIQKIQQSMQNYDSKLIQYRTTRNKITIEIGDIDNRLIQLKNILYQCLNNQQLITYCIKITQEVHQIQQSAPKFDKASMQKKLTKKLFIITTIQNNLKKARGANDQQEVRKLQAEVLQQKDQFRLLQSRVSNFQTKQQSMCAMCSQERIQQLKRNISDLQSRKATAGMKIIDLQSNIQTIQLQLADYKRTLDIIFQQKRQEITSQLCLDDECKITQKRYIAQTQIQLNQLKKSIIDKKVQFNSLKATYENRLYHVKSYLTGIDSIADCIRKREYYEELKKKRPKQLKIDYNMVNAQKSMAKQLNDFEL